MNSQDIDRLVCKHTALYSMDDLVSCTAPTYRPSLQCKTYPNKQERTELKAIADRYDTIMLMRGDQRRAFRF